MYHFFFNYITANGNTKAENQNNITNKIENVQITGGSGGDGDSPQINNNTPQLNAPKGQRENRNIRRGGGRGGGGNNRNQKGQINHAGGDATPLNSQKKETLVNGS